MKKMKIAVFIGSDSDYEVVEEALQVLKNLRFLTAWK